MPAPRIGVTFEAIRRRGPAAWLVIWRIQNRSPETLTVVEAWHPHRRFHSSRLRRSLRIPPRSAASLEVPARIDVDPRSPIENCFLILRVASGRERWRALARLSVAADESDTPRPRVEAVDVHPSEA